MADSVERKLVIVESPTKAKTIRKFLGDEYRVEASMGHVRDLPASAAEVPADIKKKPWARLGVDVENGFQPIYVVPPGKKKIVAELKEALKGATELYLATDEDREGEAIGWHLVELLNPKIPVRRMVFHEITKDAIQSALATTRELKTDLVQAQETRRVLDRLVGYSVSPLLWKKVAPRLSAGRVQSVAVRLLVLRERERMAFRSGIYWDLKATLEKEATAFEAQLVSLDGRRLATGKDFNEKTGELAPGSEALLLDEKAATELVAGAEGARFQVDGVEKRESSRSPYPPFTTSTLQQEANRKLGMSAKKTMQIAQRLYEFGHITYMRTDSVNLSEDAIKGIGAMIAKRFGSEYAAGPRRYKTKAKGAQEAHEAIRPAGTTMQTAAELELSGDQAKLYELIWKRTVASQMADAKLAFTTVKLGVTLSDGRALEFRASGREVLFSGFFRAYVEGGDESSAADDRSQPLPSLSEGDSLPCRELEALRHETKPPARYTEASLVKALEAEGIGRPSTYASIIDTIQRRGYVQNKNKQLVPTFVSMAVTKLLETTLESVVDLRFTAEMEERLDEIAEGRDGKQFLAEFYNKELLVPLEAAMDADAREICTIARWAFGELRVGRFGPFLDLPREGEENQRVSLPADVAPSEVDQAYLDKLVELARRAEEPLGSDPETGESVFAMVGPYGPYVQLGAASKEKGAPKPKRVSIPADIDPATIDLATAAALLALPRTLGEHPESGKPVQAGVGRFGPYVVHQRVFASLKTEDDVLKVEMPRALELLADKKPRRRGSEPLKELGEHPDGGAIQVMNGPYGPYIKWDKINASLPEGVQVDDVILEEAVVWVNAKAEQKGAKKKKAAAKKASKAAPKKAAPKKAAAKKKTAAAKKRSSAKKKGAAAKKRASSKKVAAEKTASDKKSSPKKGPAAGSGEPAASKAPAPREAAPKGSAGAARERRKLGGSALGRENADAHLGPRQLAASRRRRDVRQRSPGAVEPLACARRQESRAPFVPHAACPRRPAVDSLRDGHWRVFFASDSRALWRRRERPCPYRESWTARGLTSRHRRHRSLPSPF